MVHMCVKFHSHWTQIASTCFTMWPTDQKFKHDNAHTWVMRFGSYLVWWSYLVVGSCSKSFKSMGSPIMHLLHNAPLLHPNLGIYCGCLANQMVVEFGGDQSYDHMRLHKKFHQQWLKENGTPFTKLQSAPTDK